MIDASERRRWLRFSLRGLLVVVTLAAIWLGWNVYVVNQRKAALAAPGIETWTRSSALSLPPWRRWFGDQAVGIIVSNDSSHVVALKRLFPEAEVIEILEDDF
jgi:hypothetical protein